MTGRFNGPGPVGRPRDVYPGQFSGAASPSSLDLLEDTLEAELALALSGDAATLAPDLAGEPISPGSAPAAEPPAGGNAIRHAGPPERRIELSQEVPPDDPADKVDRICGNIVAEAKRDEMVRKIMAERDRVWTQEQVDDELQAADASATRQTSRSLRVSTAISVGLFLVPALTAGVFAVRYIPGLYESFDGFVAAPVTNLVGVMAQPPAERTNAGLQAALPARDPVPVRDVSPVNAQSDDADLTIPDDPSGRTGPATASAAASAIYIPAVAGASVEPHAEPTANPHPKLVAVLKPREVLTTIVPASQTPPAPPAQKRQPEAILAAIAAVPAIATMPADLQADLRIRLEAGACLSSALPEVFQKVPVFVMRDMIQQLGGDC